MPSQELKVWWTTWDIGGRVWEIWHANRIHRKNCFVILLHWFRFLSRILRSKTCALVCANPCLGCDKQCVGQTVKQLHKLARIWPSPSTRWLTLATMESLCPKRPWDEHQQSKDSYPGKQKGRAPDSLPVELLVQSITSCIIIITTSLRDSRCRRDIDRQTKYKNERNQRSTGWSLKRSVTINILTQCTNGTRCHWRFWRVQ